MLGLLLFLAITASADVLGRSSAAAAADRAKVAEEETKAAQAGLARLIPCQGPIPGIERADEQGKYDQEVTLLAAAAGDVPYFLVMDKDDNLAWLPASKVRIG